MLRYDLSFLAKLTKVKDIKTENEFLHFLMTIHDHKLIRLVSKFTMLSTPKC